MSGIRFLIFLTTNDRNITLRVKASAQKLVFLVFHPARWGGAPPTEVMNFFWLWDTIDALMSRFGKILCFGGDMWGQSWKFSHTNTACGKFCTSPKLAHVEGPPASLPLTLYPKHMYVHVTYALNQDPEHMFSVALTRNTTFLRAPLWWAHHAMMQEPIFSQIQISRLLAVWFHDVNMFWKDLVLSFKIRPWVRKNDIGFKSCELTTPNFGAAGGDWQFWLWRPTTPWCDGIFSKLISQTFSSTRCPHRQAWFT